jgi:class 3 adenylate cyclase
VSRREASGRRFATLLFTDIVGSTVIAREMGDLRWQELIRRHHAIVRRELKRFGGHELDTAGDGFFAIFDSPGVAIRCAVALTDAVREVGLEIRAGLHSGEVEIANDKPGGIAVNTAARVMSVGGHGEVLVSQALRDIVAGSSLRFEDHGVHTLKGIEGEWRLFLVTEVDGERVPEPLDGAEAAKRRMAVEPSAAPRSRRRLAAAGGIALAALAVVLAVVLAVTLGGDDEEPNTGPLLVPAAGPPSGSLVKLVADTGEIERVRSDVPASQRGFAHDIESGYGSIWNVRVPVVLKVDPHDGSTVPIRGITDVGYAIGVGLDEIWVVGRELFPVDPATGIAADGIPYSDAPPTFQAAQDVTTGFGEVWIASNDGSVIHLDPDSGVATTLEVGDTPTRIAAGTDAMWVLDDGAGAVWRIDPDSGDKTRIGVSLGVDEMAVADGFVWVLESDLGTLTPISESDGTLRPGIDVGEDAADVAAGLGSIWVASGGNVIEVSTTTKSIVRTIEIGDTPISSLTVDEEDGALWLDLGPPD